MANDVDELGPGGAGQLARLVSEMRSMRGEITALKEGATLLNASAESIAIEQKEIAAHLHRANEGLAAVYQVVVATYDMCGSGFGFVTPDEEPDADAARPDGEADGEPHDDAGEDPPAEEVNRQ